MDVIAVPTTVVMMGSTAPLVGGQSFPLFLAGIIGVGSAMILGGIFWMFGIVRSTMTLLSLVLLMTVLPGATYLAYQGWQLPTQATSDIRLQVHTSQVTASEIQLAVQASKAALITANYGVSKNQLQAIVFTSDPAAVQRDAVLTLKNLSPKTMYYIQVYANGVPIGPVLQIATK